MKGRDKQHMLGLDHKGLLVLQCFHLRGFEVGLDVGTYSLWALKFRGILAVLSPTRVVGFSPTHI